MFRANHNLDQQGADQATNPTTSQRQTTINIQPNRYEALHHAAMGLGVTGLGTLAYSAVTEANKEAAKDVTNFASRKSGIGDLFTPGTAENAKVDKPKVDSNQIVSSQSSAEIDGGVITKQGTFKDGDKSVEIRFFDSTGKAKVDLARVEADERLEKQKIEAQEREDIRQNELTKEKMQMDERNTIRGVGVGLLAGAAGLELARAAMQRMDANAILAAQNTAMSRQDQVYVEMDRICRESEEHYNNLIQRNENPSIEELEHLRTEFQSHLPHFQALPDDLGRPGCMRCNAKINQINSRIAGINDRNQRAQRERSDDSARRQEQQRATEERITQFSARIDELLNADEAVDLQPAVATLENEIRTFREQNPTVNFPLNISQNLDRLRSTASRHVNRHVNTFS